MGEGTEWRYKYTICKQGFRQNIYLRIRRGSGLKVGGTAIIDDPPPIGGPECIFLPEASYDDPP